jgi:hypothetical protein
VENHVCLSRGVQLAGAAWRAVTTIVAGVRDLVQRTGAGCTYWVLSRWTIGGSGDAVGGLYHAHEDENHRFLS